MQRFRPAAQVADAHGAGVDMAPDLVKCLHLQCADKGDQGIGCCVPALRQKTDAEENEDFHQDNDLLLAERMLFATLGQNGINVRMITQGPQELNIIFGVDNKDFDNAIRVLYNSFVKSN